MRRIYGHNMRVWIVALVVGTWGSSGLLIVDSSAGANLADVAAESGALQWQSSTLFGGSGGDTAWDSAVGPDGSLYVVGQTASGDFPTTAPLQASYGGEGDAFVLRIAPDRQSLVYATFLGGSKADAAVGVAVGSAGEAFVVGITESPDFPRGTVSRNQPGTGADLFAVRISSDGSSIDYSTVLGGNGVDGADDIALAADGTFYVAGSTSSSDFPLEHPFQSALRGEVDGLVLRFDGTSGHLLLSSYLGGSGIDEARSVVVAQDGAVYLAGNTDSVDLGPSSGEQLHYGGGPTDIFIARLSNSGGALVATSYLGGESQDMIGPGSLALDSVGALLVTGSTASSNFPVLNSVKDRLSGWYDGIVAVIEPQTLTLKFSTFLGGRDSDFATRALSDGHTIYVTGTSASTDFPVICGMQSQHSPERYDTFIASLNTVSRRLAYASFAGAGTGRSIARGSASEIVVSGEGLGIDLRLLNSWPFSTRSNSDTGLFFVSLNRSVGACAGDCCADGQVTVDDLIKAVGIALGSHVAGDCESVDTDRDGHVSIGELIVAVRGGLGECGA